DQRERERERERALRMPIPRSLREDICSRLKRGVAAGRSAERGTSAAAAGGGGRSAPDPAYALAENRRGAKSMYFKQFLHDETGCASYFLASRQSREALVVDPQLDIRPYIDLAQEREY